MACLKTDLLLECCRQVERVGRHAGDRAAREHEAVTFLTELLQRVWEDSGEARAEGECRLLLFAGGRRLGKHVQHPVVLESHEFADIDEPDPGGGTPHQAVVGDQRQGYDQEAQERVEEQRLHAPPPRSRNTSAMASSIDIPRARRRSIAMLSSCRLLKSSSVYGSRISRVTPSPIGE